MLQSVHFATVLEDGVVNQSVPILYKLRLEGEISTTR